MTLAIKWGDDNDQTGGFVYLDAVTLYTQNYKGKVTSHPIANGGVVSDHFVRDNPTFTVGAVITGVDISTGTYLIQDLAGNSPFNVNEAPNAVVVKSSNSSMLQKFIPDSVGQFMASSSPEVIVDTRRADLIEQIRQALIDLSSGLEFYNTTHQFEPTVQLVKLYEFDGSIIRKIINNLVIIDINFKEDASSGHALYCDIKFEQVTFAYLKKTTIPADVIKALKKKAAPKKDKGKQDGTPGAVGGTGGPADTDALKPAIKELL